jgi:hypothetical protein
VPDLRTTVTEIVTGLGTLGHENLDDALAARPAELVNVAPATWDHLDAAAAGGALGDVFAAAWANGRALLHARDGLRGRRPVRVEWKGSVRAPGDEVVPADLRIDHVFFVSCKYLSRIVINASPAHLFDRQLHGGHGQRGGGDWFDEVAPAAHQALYRAVTRGEPGLPARVVDLGPADRRRLAERLRGGWPAEAQERYAELAGAVALASSGRWVEGLCSSNDRLRLVWRLLRIGSAPYYVLGTAPPPARGGVRRDGEAGVRPAANSAEGAGRCLRLRVATAWDWQQRYELRAFETFPQAGGQPRVGWRAAVRDRLSAATTAVEGHVEVRWSHGRFCGPPEAKVYLDTPHADVPGYEPLR